MFRFQSLVMMYAFWVPEAGQLKRGCVLSSLSIVVVVIFCSIGRQRIP